MSRPSKRIAPETGSTRRMHRLRRGRLAAARLADQREHLAGRERERHSVDGVHRLPRPAERRADEPAGDRVANDEIVDLEQRGAHDDGAHDPAGTRSLRWHAAL